MPLSMLPQVMRGLLLERITASEPWPRKRTESDHRPAVEIVHLTQHRVPGSGQAFGFNSSSVNCLGSMTGTTRPMGSPRLMVVGLVNCSRKLAVKAS